MQSLNFGQHRVYIYESAEALKQAAAEHIINICAQRAGQADTVSIALSGGSTPIGVYQNLLLLATDQSTLQFPWHQSQFFFGDERYVPHDDEQSNYRMAMNAFLKKANVADDHIHAIPTDCELAETCAQHYAERLSILEQVEGIPVFDYVLLGIGDDGHTASLFPGTSIIDERDKNVAAVYVEKFQAWRISLTFPVLNRARVCSVLVSGASKASVFADVVQNANKTFPVALIENTHGINWFVDQEAASKLS